MRVAGSFSGRSCGAIRCLGFWPFTSVFADVVFQNLDVDLAYKVMALLTYRGGGGLDKEFTQFD